MMLLAQSSSVYYQLGRLQSLSEWWHWLVLGAACLVVAVFVGYMYRRDSVELPRGLAVLLFTLRLLAFVGILFYFFNLEKRAERRLVKNSRAVVLVDTSQSMALRDFSPAGTPEARTRSDQVVAELAEGNLIHSLRQKHDVVVYRFDEAEVPTEIAAFAKTPLGASQDDDSLTAPVLLAAALRQARGIALVAAGLLAASLLSGMVYLVWGRASTSGEQSSWSLLASMVSLIAGLVVLAVANLRHPDVGLLAIVGLKEPAPADAKRDDSSAREDEATSDPQVDWAQQLLPRGGATRIGDNLQFLVDKERGGPIAAIVLISDGGQNDGLDYDVAAAAAANAMIPVYTVGIGSDRHPANLRVVDLEAPERVYPGDKFTLTGYVQAHGTSRTSVTVELFSSEADGKNEVKEDERAVDVGSAGLVATVKFELTPEQQGVRRYRLRVQPIEGEIDKADNEKMAKVEIVDRKTKVLLLAGGPHRDFIFLRNQLYRDKDVTVDVLLQSAPPGSSQEANEVLTKFPETEDELFEYDCIVAFDPDWEALDELQVNLLERWVGEKAGGLIVVAGPVYTPQWSTRRRGDERIDKIKALYPVVFYYQGAATLSLGRFGGDKPWPLQFTRDGEAAEFLWFDDDADKSRRVREEFAGVYGYYAVKDPKPGARVFARFSDPDTAIDGELPIYMAGHFYGSGRVFFQASCELWRIRELDERYFETYYTKLIRWAAEGRLLRDSSRGVLLVDKDRALVGDQIAVRAILQDSQHRPLAQPDVQAFLVQPDGKRQTLTLKRLKDEAHEGIYVEQFTVLQEGDHRLELVHPDAADQVLIREVRARIPSRETERPERNDQVLRTIAERTGGAYYVGLAAVRSPAEGRPPLATVLQPKDQTTILAGTPDRQFERLLMTWLMGLICGVLCLEWLIRRLSKLA
jgi:hypothetical protein